VSGGQEEHSRLRTKLPGAERKRPDEALHDVRAAGGDGGAGHDHRVEAAKLAVEGNRVRPGHSEIEERPSAVQRPGEPHCLDMRVGDQPLSRLAPVYDRESAGRRTGLDQRRRNQRRGPRAGPWMAVVGLHDDRAARSQRRRGVASGDREREREVARGEHRDWSDRVQHPPQLGPGRRLRVRVWVVDDDQARPPPSRPGRRSHAASPPASAANRRRGRQAAPPCRPRRRSAGPPRPVSSLRILRRGSSRFVARSSLPASSSVRSFVAGSLTACRIVLSVALAITGTLFEIWTEVSSVTPSAIKSCLTRFRE
jgi:hypothetical protein